MKKIRAILIIVMFCATMLAGVSFTNVASANTGTAPTTSTSNNAGLSYTLTGAINTGTVNPSGNSKSFNAYQPFTGAVTVDVGSVNYNGYTNAGTTNSGSFTETGTLYQTVDGVNYYKYTWSNTVSWTNPSNTQAFQWSTSSPSSSLTASPGNGNYIGSNIFTSDTLSMSNVELPAASSITISWAVENTIESASTSIVTILPTDMIQSGDYFNITDSITLPSETSWLNGATVDGQAWNSVYNPTLTNIPNALYNEISGTYDFNGVSQPTSTTLKYYNFTAPVYTNPGTPLRPVTARDTMRDNTWSKKC